ncbi:uncharacterized protein Z520_06528 [Fonsecaea multimorphosa CBS 102226]|uniref:Uncharacterized protein n=1 Tax=Fonsecaea multimorphosa CBS 102226 TaxID=1442371 RepID=A0A0D2H7C0_9EURO|nr:uncharacterized protein Z520_06528 [Fonsecaea multimorphosa CBS 102226]KIX97750.1 hypothetical protein Z520_06528 [Fonsecaea multimorphosa CBS 102226]OAL23770.1 hypothetical protein AYO22_06089 [Fonsecaea multimorphosa]
MGVLQGGILTVTGAASGMGREVALAFAREGARGLVIGDLAQEGLAETKKMVTEKWPAVEVVASSLDVSDEASVKAFVDLAVSKFGSIDYSVHAAGVAPQMLTVMDSQSDALQKCIAVNYKGVFLCCRAIIAQMLKQSPMQGLQVCGSIINITSLAGHGGAFQNLPSYTGSKAAPEALTRVLAQDFGPEKIRVNSIAPGFTLTPMLKKHAKLEDMEYVANVTPMRRLANPEDIANACVLMSSSLAGFITGQSLAVDGGLSLEHYC